ncbi:MAG: bifunctional DNA primase/polymerase [Halobacteriota archaeon]
MKNREENGGVCASLSDLQEIRSNRINNAREDKCVGFVGSRIAPPVGAEINNERLDAALSCAARGWPVVAVNYTHGPLNACSCDQGVECKSPAKHPNGLLAPHGAADATTDPDVIRDWFRKSPRGNVGGLVGPRSGIAQIDIDTHNVNGVKVDGLAAWGRLEEANREIKTLTHGSGGDGQHKFIVVPAELGAFTVTVADGVQVRYSDNYIAILPPSVHASGKHYTVVDDSPIADCPEWLSKLIREKLQDQPHTSKTLPTEARTGSRHHSLISLIGVHVRRRDAKEVALTQALAYNAEHCVPPKSEDEVRRLVDDLYYRYSDPSKTYETEPKIERQYRVRSDGVYVERAKLSQKGWRIEVKKVSNFAAWISKVIATDDGIETLYTYVIDGELLLGEGETEPLPTLEVSSKDFAALKWAFAWHPHASISPMMLARETFRDAVQKLSVSTQHETVYAHTGWVVLDDGEFVFLTTSGAVGASRLNTRVRFVPKSDRLQHYCLPEPLEGNALIKAGRQILALFDEDFAAVNGGTAVASKRIMYPQLGRIGRAPLNHAHPSVVVDWINGWTGERKTALYAACQSFFGKDFVNPLTATLNWISTANRREYDMFWAKDVLCNADDFKRPLNLTKAARYDDDADQTIRSHVDKRSRERLTYNLKGKPSMPSRCGLGSTGEDMPRGLSTVGRSLVTTITKGAVNLAALSVLQDLGDQDMLAGFTSAYIKWLAPQMDAICMRCKDEHVAKRDAYGKIFESMGTHSRVPEVLAEYSVGFEYLVRFCVERDILSAQEAAALQERYGRVMIQAGKDQQVFTDSEDPIEQFKACLPAMLSSGVAHLCDVKTNEHPFRIHVHQVGWISEDLYDDENLRVLTRFRPKGKRIGWTDASEGKLYLDPQPTFTEFSAFLRRQGSAIELKQATFWQRLLERGLILEHDDGRTSKLKTIAKAKKRVLCLDLSVIYEEALDEEEQQYPENGNHKAEAPIEMEW